MMHTLQERVELVSLYYQKQNCAEAGVRIRGVFVETGSVRDKNRAPIGIVNYKGAAVAVLRHIQLMPNTQSVRQLSAVLVNLTFSEFYIDNVPSVQN